MNNDFLHEQLIKLGDMMGDGLHYEPDGKWIEKEYGRIFNALYPEHKKERRKQSIENINLRVAKLIEKDVCVCGGKLEQSRSGSKVMICTICTARYKLRSVKKGKSA